MTSMLTARAAEVHLDDEGPRVRVGVIKQQVEAVAFGSPSEARTIGGEGVDEHDEDLRRLADS